MRKNDYKNQTTVPVSAPRRNDSFLSIVTPAKYVALDPDWIEL